MRTALRSPTRSEIFTFLPDDVQVQILESEDPQEVANLIAEMPPDDRVDLIKDAEPETVDEVMPLLPADERRDIQRLRAYPEGTAGSVMTRSAARAATDRSWSSSTCSKRKISTRW